MSVLHTFLGSGKDEAGRHSRALDSLTAIGVALSRSFRMALDFPRK